MNIPLANSYMLKASDDVHKTYWFCLSMILLICLEVLMVCCAPMCSLICKNIGNKKSVPKETMYSENVAPPNLFAAPVNYSTRPESNTPLI